jgi:dTDP-4-dehydrorhamnose reductase
MRFAIIGDSGLFGTEILKRLSSLDYEVAGFNRENIDLSDDFETLASSLEGSHVIVNAVGYTAVDKAEAEPEIANYVNGEIPGKLAQAARLIDARFMHISTDYLFDGKTDTPYKKTSQVNPQTAYGRSKELGERLVMQAGSDHTIFRTAWLYGQFGKCFPLTIEKLLQERDVVDVVDNQIGTPTWARDLADIVIEHAANNYAEPIVHAVSSGKTSWFGFAEEIKNSLPMFEFKQIRNISSNQYITDAARPEFSVLDNTQTAGPVVGDWLDRWKVAASHLFPN